MENEKDLLERLGTKFCSECGELAQKIQTPFIRGFHCVPCAMKKLAKMMFPNRPPTPR